MAQQQQSQQQQSPQQQATPIMEPVHHTTQMQQIQAYDAWVRHLYQRATSEELILTPWNGDENYGIEEKTGIFLLVPRPNGRIRIFDIYICDTKLGKVLPEKFKDWINLNCARLLGTADLDLSRIMVSFNQFRGDQMELLTSSYKQITGPRKPPYLVFAVESYFQYLTKDAPNKLQPRIFYGPVNYMYSEHMSDITVSSCDTDDMYAYATSLGMDYRQLCKEIKLKGKIKKPMDNTSNNIFDMDTTGNDVMSINKRFEENKTEDNTDIRDYIMGRNQNNNNNNISNDSDNPSPLSQAMLTSDAAMAHILELQRAILDTIPLVNRREEEFLKQTQQFIASIPGRLRLRYMQQINANKNISTTINDQITSLSIPTDPSKAQIRPFPYVSNMTSDESIQFIIDTVGIFELALNRVHSRHQAFIRHVRAFTRDVPNPLNHNNNNNNNNNNTKTKPTK